MRRFLSSLATASAFSLALALAGCFGEGEENPNGTEVENEVKGILRLADGTPALGAKVRLFPVDFSPLREGSDTVEPYSATTDSRGVYRIRDVRPGEYNVLGGLNNLLSYRDSVGVTAGKDELPPDTLRAPGSLTGFVALQPNHLPSTATVEILGTRYFANVDDSSAFRFPGLAGGRYSIRVSTTVPEYTPLYTGITVKGGISDTLADTLRPAYTGIPVVTGLRATFDTLHSVVRLAWNPVRYSHLEDYLIYRDPADRLIPNNIVVGSSRDTVFFDTLLDLRSGFPGGQSPPAHRYRIKVRNLSDQIGLSFRSLEVATPPPTEVATLSTFRLVRFEWSPALQADSVTVRVDLVNQSRGLDSVTWALGTEDSVVARHGLGGRGKETDSLRFVWPKQGSFRIYLRVKDDAGTVSRDSLLVLGNTAPSIQGGTVPDTLKAGVLFRFQPTASDPERDSLKFSAAGLPAWATLNPATGLLQGTPDNSQAGDYAGIVLSVTDGRRSASLSPIRFTVKTYPWSIRTMPASITDPTVSPFGEELVVISTGSKFLVKEGEGPGAMEPGWIVHFYNPKADAWREASFIPGSSIEKHFLQVSASVIRHAFPLGERILLMVDELSVIRPFILDPGTGQVEARKPSLRYRNNHATAFLDGKAYLLGGLSHPDFLNSVEEYDPASDTWTERKPLPYFVERPGAVGVNGKILLFGGRYGSVIPQDAVSYTPATDTWEARAQVGVKMRGWGMKGCAAGGKAYAFAGMTLGPDNYEIWSDLLQQYDPASDAWSTRIRPVLNRDARPAVCAEMGGKLFLFGGATSPAYQVINFHKSVEVYDPAVDKP